jgi:hypothetical protein
LEPGECLELDNYLVDQKALRTREGASRLNAVAFTTSSTGSRGGIRAIFSDGTKKTVVAGGGNLYAIDDSGNVTTLSVPGTLSDEPTLMETFQDRVLILSRGDTLLAYDGTNDPHRPETVSPQIERLISGFEDTSTWTVYAGGGTVALDQEHYIQGSAGIEFTTATGTTLQVYGDLGSNLSPNLTQFLDETASDTNDYITIDVFITDSSHIQGCTLYLTDINPFDDLAVGYKADLVAHKDWPDGLSYQYVTLRIRKKDMVHVGSPDADWNQDIRYIGLEIEPETGYAVSLTADYLRMERSGPIAEPYGVVLSTIEPGENWSSSLGSVLFQTRYTGQGFRSLKLNNTIYSALLTFDSETSMGADAYPDGKDAAADDEITFLIAKGNGVACDLTIRFYKYDAVSGYDSLVYYEHTASPIPSALPGYMEFSVYKDDFLAVGGISSWDSIGAMEFIKDNTAGTATYYLDYVRLVPRRATDEIVSVEPHESGVTLSLSTGSPRFNTNVHDDHSTRSLVMKARPGSDLVATWTFDTARDLSQYTTGESSTSGDTIGPWVYVSSKVKRIGSIVIDIDGSGADPIWTRYFRYIVEGEEIDRIKGKFRRFAVELRFPKGDYAQITPDATDPSWSGCNGVRLTLTPAKKRRGAVICVDSWLMERAGALTGRFQYKVTYVNYRNIESTPSLPSDPTPDVNSSDIYVYNLPVAGGNSASQVKARRLYRYGGGSSEWKLVGEIIGNDITTYIDHKTDEELGVTLGDVTNTTFRAKAMAKLGRHIWLGNLTDPTGYEYPSGYVQSESGTYEIFDETKIIEVAPQDGGEIMALVPFEDELHILKETSHWKHNDETDQPVQLHGEYGLSAPKAWAIAGNALYYWSRPYGIIQWDGSQHTRFGLKQAKPILDDVHDDAMELVDIVYHDEYLFIAYSTQTSAPFYNDKILWCYLPAGIWGTISAWPVGAWIPFPDKGKLYFATSHGDSSDYLVEAFAGDTDWGNAITTTYQSRHIPFGVPEQAKEMHRLYLNGAKLTATDVALTIQPYADCDSYGSVITSHSITSTSNTHARVTFPPLGIHRFYLGYKITATARHVLRTASLVSSFMPVR